MKISFFGSDFEQNEGPIPGLYNGLAGSLPRPAHASQQQQFHHPQVQFGSSRTGFGFGSFSLDVVPVVFKLFTECGIFFASYEVPGESMSHH